MLIDEVSVEVSDAGGMVWHRRPGGVHTGEAPVPHVVAAAGQLPLVTATRRRDNGPPDEVEIVLDGPISYNATTRFTFDDGVAVNVVEFTFAPGDTDGDGDADLADFSRLANCMAEFPVKTGPCLVLDNDDSGELDADDYAAFGNVLSGP